MYRHSSVASHPGTWVSVSRSHTQARPEVAPLSGSDKNEEGSAISHAVRVCKSRRRRRGRLGKAWNNPGGSRMRVSGRLNDGAGDRMPCALCHSQCQCQCQFSLHGHLHQGAGAGFVNGGLAISPDTVDRPSVPAPWAAFSASHQHAPMGGSSADGAVPAKHS